MDSDTTPILFRFLQAAINMLRLAVRYHSCFRLGREIDNL